MRNFVAAVCFALAFGGVALGQSVVGRLKPVTDNTVLGTPNQLLAVNLLSPATATGSLTTATLNWAGGPCTAGFKLKFIRKVAGETYSVISERGPFNVTSGLTTVALAPAVSVAKGDFIGVQHLKADCGSVIISATDPTKVTGATISGDVQSFDLKTATIVRGLEINARASTTADVFEGTIVVAGAAQGGFGSNFRTTVALTNSRSGQTITGRLVYHPAGQAASANDPFVPYSLDSNGSLTFNDIVTVLGKTGIGSIDLYTTSSYRPVVSARVYDDRGTLGTSGFNEDLLAPSDALFAPEQVYFAIPQDANFRQNVGIRTLDAGASIQYLTLFPTGFVAGVSERTYPANYFEQVSAASLFANPIPAGGSLRIRVTAGSAHFYVSTTDNRTNDSSAQFSRRE